MTRTVRRAAIATNWAIKITRFTSIAGCQRTSPSLITKAPPGCDNRPTPPPPPDSRGGDGGDAILLVGRSEDFAHPHRILGFVDDIHDTHRSPPGIGLTAESYIGDLSRLTVA